MHHVRPLLLLTVVLLSLSALAQTADGMTDTTDAKKDTVAFSKLKFEAFRQLARFENKPYFIVFGASWCAPCHRIKNEIFTNGQIAHLANENFLAFYLDLEDFDGVEINSKLFKISQLPTVLFFDPTGRKTDAAVGVFDGYYFFRKLRAHIPQSQWGKDWIETGVE